MKILRCGAIAALFCFLSQLAFGQQYIYPEPVPVPLPIPLPIEVKEDKKADKKKDDKKTEAKKAEPKKAEKKKDEPYILGPCEKKCPQCGKHVCHVEYKLEKVKKVVYEVECKQVCIPDIRLIRMPKLNVRCKSCGKCNLFKKCGCGDACCSPCGPQCGQGCGCQEPRCGRVRTVKVLRRKVIECDVCRCHWKVEKCPEPCVIPCEAPCEPGCAGHVGVPISQPIDGVRVPQGTHQVIPVPGQVMPPVHGEVLPGAAPTVPTIPKMPYATGRGKSAYNPETPTNYVPPLLRR